VSKQRTYKQALVALRKDSPEQFKTNSVDKKLGARLKRGSTVASLETNGLDRNFGGSYNTTATTHSYRVR